MSNVENDAEGSVPNPEGSDGESKPKKLRRKSKTGNTGTNQQKNTQAQAPEPEEQTLTVDGSMYAPVSLEKMVAQGHFDHLTQDKEKHSICVIIPCENGLVADHPEIVNIMIADRVMQTAYFVDEVFPKLPRVPAYLYRFISWIMFEDGEKPMKYPSDNDFLMALQSGLLKQTDPEYKQIEGFIKWGKSNTEATHLIGLVQLVGGALKQASKKNSGLRLFIELPETGFHPKRERLIMSLLYKLQEEYGIKADWTEIEK